MSPATHKSFFVDEELAALQRAFDAACVALDLRSEDLTRREQLGAFVFQIAQSGERDEAILRTHAVRRFRALAGVRSGPENSVALEIFASVPKGRTSLRPGP